MKNLSLFIAFFFLVSATCFAQLTKVNQSCKQMPCESGLYCVTLKNGDQKCATCDQSTLNSLTGNVDDYCKGFDVAWTPGSSPEFQEALATDGRVWVDVFDIMIEKAKKCKEAREYREDKCWDDGDDEHKKAINMVAESISRMADHKYRQISDKRVYYCTESNYESKLSTYGSKCGLTLDQSNSKFNNIGQKLDIMKNSMKAGNKINCSAVEDYNKECEYCIEAAKDLFYYGFRSNSSYIPNSFSEVLNKVEEISKNAKSILDDTKSKSLCE